MRFGPWYPLREAGDHAPSEENVLQLRVREGLVDYPKGKSAMVRYAHAPDARAAAVMLARELAVHDLLCRHVVEGGGDYASALARLRDEFVRRFGTEPALP